LAAEAEFSVKGFDGAGMKAIASRADVSQGLLHYHFGTKDRLYEEVIKHRSEKINSERLELLAKVDLTGHDALDKILEALFRPPLGPSGGDITYARIFSRLVVGHDREQALVKQFYDPTAQQFIAALKTAIPGADQAVAATCYSLSLGALITMIGRDGRVERLMGRDDPQHIDEILEQLVLFAKGGAMALAQSK
jgi:AcrR family transcriptional regulator